MSNKFQYRLSTNQKNEIAHNLINFLQKDENLSELSKIFIGNWILTGPDEKRKSFFDVWAIVLKNYLPTTRPVLFRACKRIGQDGKIASFTGRLECARRFSNGRGSILICDTKELLEYEEEFHSPREYKYSFYPLVSVLKKAKDLGGCGFSDRLLSDYLGEDEYIMRINLGNMHSFKWKRNEL